MGCMSHRRNNIEIRPETKWDFISLNDFKATSCFTPFAYGYLWFSLLISTAVYGVDTFTAFQLLAFNSWASEVKPPHFEFTKWIFAVCIILSFVNLAFEHIRARKVMNRGSVAESFLDNIAVRLESARVGKNLGWKRFLVFAELTRSKKGTEYVALFTYFSFQSWFRVLVCSGPRQGVNAFTLWNVYTKNLVIEGQNFESSIANFFHKIMAFAESDARQALILSGMTFTLVIWVFSFLSLFFAALCFLFYLWYSIPREDGGLTGYCERKVNKRLMKIVSAKINKAMEEDERKRRKAELKAAKKNGEARPASMKPSLPQIAALGEDGLPPMPGLNRTDTMSTLPAYSSNSTTPGQIELNPLDQKRSLPTRTATNASSSTSLSQTSSRQPLLRAAAELGFNRPASPAPSIITTGTRHYPPARRGYGLDGPLQPRPTGGSEVGSDHIAGPGAFSSDTLPSLPPLHSSNRNATNGYRRVPGPHTAHSRPLRDNISSGRASPAPSMSSYRGGPPSSRGIGPGGYPIRNPANPMPPPDSPSRPQRTMTAARHQATDSTSTLNSGISLSQRVQQEPAGSQHDYFNQPPPSRSQRDAPRWGYANDHGWGQDVERGPAPRF